MVTHQKLAHGNSLDLHHRPLTACTVESLKKCWEREKSGVPYIILIRRVEILNCDIANFVPSRDVFGKIGCACAEHHIQIEENAIAAVNPTQRVPYAPMDRHQPRT